MCVLADKLDVRGVVTHEDQTMLHVIGSRTDSCCHGANLVPHSCHTAGVRYGPARIRTRSRMDHRDIATVTAFGSARRMCQEGLSSAPPEQSRAVGAAAAPRTWQLQCGQRCEIRCFWMQWPASSRC